MRSSPLIRIESVRKSFHGKLAIDRISLDLLPGVATGLVGPNGSGKSTLMNLITGALLPDEGRRSWEEPYPGVGYQSETSVFPALVTGQVWLDWHEDLAGKESDGCIQEAVRLFHFADILAQPLSTYSKGMRKKMSVLLAMVGNPNVVLFDEPFEGMDPIDRESMALLIRTLTAKDRHVVVCSHTLSELHQSCDRLIFLDQGRIKHVLIEGEDPIDLYRRFYA